MSGRFCLDANIFLSTWYVNYPPRIFSRLWEQIAVNKSDIILLKPIFDEIEPFTSSDKNLPITIKEQKYPLRCWIEKEDFTITPVDDAVNALSLSLEKEYETNNNSKGAGQIDIMLIAYAKLNDKIVVTFENKQKQKPQKKYNYKIPLICSEQQVNCISYIELLDQLNIKT